MMFLTKLMLLTASQTDADLSTVLEETKAVAEEVHEDLQNLKPNVILDTLKSWLPGLMSFGYRLAIAILILVIGNRIVHVVRRFLQKTFERMNMDPSVSRFLISVADACIYALAIFIAADKLGIPSASIIALLGSAGLAVGLSLQGSLANVAGGILLMLLRPFGVHDYIVSDGYEGTVQSIGLAYTTIITVDNKKITIPNGQISNSTVVNVTAQEKRRVDLVVGIGYSSDMKKAKELIRRVYENHPLVLAEDGITVYVNELADSAVMIGGRGWTKTENYWQVRWMFWRGSRKPLMQTASRSRSTRWILISAIPAKKQKNLKRNYSKNSFKSSSTVPIPAMPKFSTSTFATFGDKKAGRVGPRWIFFTPRYKRASRTMTAFCSYHAIL